MIQLKLNQLIFTFFPVSRSLVVLVEVKGWAIGKAWKLDYTSNFFFWSIVLLRTIRTVSFFLFYFIFFYYATGANTRTSSTGVWITHWETWLWATSEIKSNQLFSCHWIFNLGDEFPSVWWLKIETQNSTVTEDATPIMKQEIGNYCFYYKQLR